MAAPLSSVSSSGRRKERLSGNTNRSKTLSNLKDKKENMFKKYCEMKRAADNGEFAREPESCFCESEERVRFAVERKDS